MIRTSFVDEEQMDSGFGAGSQDGTFPQYTDPTNIVVERTLTLVEIASHATIMLKEAKLTDALRETLAERIDDLFS